MFRTHLLLREFLSQVLIVNRNFEEEYVFIYYPTDMMTSKISAEIVWYRNTLKMTTRHSNNFMMLSS